MSQNHQAKPPLQMDSFDSGENLPAKKKRTFRLRNVKDRISSIYEEIFRSNRDFTRFFTSRFDANRYAKLLGLVGRELVITIHRGKTCGRCVFFCLGEKDVKMSWVILGCFCWPVLVSNTMSARKKIYWKYPPERYSSGMTCTRRVQDCLWWCWF